MIPDVSFPSIFVHSSMPSKNFATDKALLSTEGIELSFSSDGLRRIAELAWQVNEKTENIGARRLHTVMERLLEEASFEAADKASGNATICVNSDYVDKQIGELSADEDLSRFIL